MQNLCAQGRQLAAGPNPFLEAENMRCAFGWLLAESQKCLFEIVDAVFSQHQHLKTSLLLRQATCRALIQVIRYPTRRQPDGNPPCGIQVFAAEVRKTRLHLPPTTSKLLRLLASTHARSHCPFMQNCGWNAFSFSFSAPRPHYPTFRVCLYRRFGRTHPVFACESTYL